MDKFIDVEKDMNWFFNHSAASIKFGSGWGSLIMQANGVSIHKIDFHPDGKILSGAKRLRSIYQRLDRLSYTHQRCLSATYNWEYQFPVDVVLIFGNKTGSLLISSFLDLKDLIRISKKIKKQNLTQEEEKIVFQLRNESNKLFEEAHNAYRRNL